MSAFTVRDGVLYRDGVEATDADALEICRELSPAIQKFVPNKPKMPARTLYAFARAVRLWSAKPVRLAAYATGRALSKMGERTASIGVRLMAWAVMS